MSSNVSTRGTGQGGGASSAPAGAGTASVRPDSVRRWANSVAAPATSLPEGAGGRDSGAVDGHIGKRGAKSDPASQPASDAIPSPAPEVRMNPARPLNRLRGDALPGALATAQADAQFATASGHRKAAPGGSATPPRGHDDPRAADGQATGPSGHSPARPPTGEPLAEQTLPLLALRGRHDSHRESRGDDSSREQPAGGEAVDERAPGAGAPSSLQPLSQSGPTSNAAEAASASSHDHLQSLIASCCDRLWVSDGANGVPQGLMLDLGRWMPGCTLEVAKAAGALRISMRGVDGERAEAMEKELDALGDDLATRLGCRVVVAVDRHKKYPG